MEVILTVILVAYLGGKIIKFLFKFFVARKFSQFTGGGSWEDFVKGAGGRQNGGASAAGGRDGASADKKEGEVTVTTVADHHKKVSDKVGDYVDFEDVKS